MLSSTSAVPPTVAEERWHYELRNAAYWDVVKVDPFARSRITNFVRRADTARLNVFNVHEAEMAGRRVYVASCSLTLPEPHRSYVAEGVAENPKDAELLAAMHAERVCDALGVPLFRLPSMQRRHAESARAEGRYAPLPEDPVRPEGTPVPPPLRMVPALHHPADVAPASARPPERGEEHGASWKAGEGGRSVPPPPPPQQPPHSPLFMASVAEATVVEVHPTEEADDASSLSLATSWSSSRSLFSGVKEAGAADPDASAVSERGGGWHQRFRESIWFPWTESPRHHRQRGAPPTSSASPAVATGNGVGSWAPPSLPADAAAFDPTEGALWDMTTTASTRCSPTPQDALVLPCVYEPAALERIKHYYLQHKVSWKDHLVLSSVSVSGSSTRMYVAELRLATREGGGHGVVTAKGKAQTPEMATNLAAMHAELLLDALGLPLSPADDVRQARHARAAASFGRWAPNPLTGDTVLPPSVQHAPLPRPLKQQIGGDEIWLDPSMISKANAYTRSDGERVIGAMNDLNYFCGDCVEVNPPEEWLTEAVNVLRQWQVNVAGNPFPELYVITVMGDFYRATTLTPVPLELGVRGGNAIGRSIEQAVQLCAMHAVDSLCALGIPLYTDPKEQERFIWRRKLLGLVTHEDMKGMTRPKGLVSILKPSIVYEEGNDGRDYGQPTADDPFHEENKAGSGGSFPEGIRAAVHAPCSGRTTRAYLPGYLIEGNVRRLPPHIQDTLAILQLRIPGDFAVCGGEAHAAASPTPGWGRAEGGGAAPSNPNPIPPPTTAAEALQSYGNDVKTCIQNYLRQQHGLRRLSRPALLATLTKDKDRHAVSPLSEEEEREVLRQLRDYSTSVLPAVYITGYGKQVSVHNIAYLRVPRPLCNVAAKEEGHDAAGPASREEPPPLLAVGISLKKKDAERVCYVHAAALLKHHCGVDVATEHRAGLPRQGSIASFADVAARLLPDGYFPTPDAPEASPKPLMNYAMRQFMESGRHYTAPRKRPAPRPFNPF